ncbi:hypothetical protein OG985_43995 [Streptomyces sp. NBC_00289]|uniref:hypothetical protein n=1 Tax=Streptomyces sp. NBC_00289 TaxID=2975703 RepID=UPI00324CD09E
MNAFVGDSPLASRSASIRPACGCRPRSPQRFRQLRLGDLLARRPSEHGQAAPHPSPDRDTGLLLGFAQRRAGRAAAVANNGLTQVVPVRLTGSDDPEIHCHADHATRL